MTSPESGVEPKNVTSADQFSEEPGHSEQPQDTATDTNESCDADAFMDEEDADAVAERLRQLGYI